MNEYPKAVSRIAVSYLILFFSFKLGTIECISNWIAYWMIYNTLETIAVYEKSVMLLRSLTILLIGYELISWLLSAFGVMIDQSFLTIFFLALSLYLHYQLLTNLADIAQRHQCSQAKRIRQLRDARTLFSTISVLPISWNMTGMIIFIAIGLIISIWLMRTLYTYSYDEKLLVRKQAQIARAMESS